MPTFLDAYYWSQMPPIDIFVITKKDFFHIFRSYGSMFSFFIVVDITVALYALRKKKVEQALCKNVLF